MSISTFFGFKTYARPVWSGSIAGPVKFRPLTKREAVRRYQQARRFERQTRQPGKQDGALGRNGLAIVHAFLFDFLNFRSGRLDPGYKAIARAANISMRSVARGLAKLKACGVISWLRRCSSTVDEAGRFSLAQETNAYSVSPTSQWSGYSEPPPVFPEAGTWGEHPCGERDPLTEAFAERRQGASTEAMLRVLDEADADEGVDGALLRLGRGALRRTLGFPGAPDRHRNRASVKS
jgi:hypothetical protein